MRSSLIQCKHAAYDQGEAAVVAFGFVTVSLAPGEELPVSVA